MGTPMRTQLISHQDQKFLTTKFLKICGGDKTPYLTIHNFDQFTQFHTEFFNHRIFNIIEKTNEDKISCADLIHFVETYSDLSTDEKIDFIFTIFDANNDGILDKSELFNMMKASMLENGLSFDDKELDLLATTLLEEGIEPGSDLESLNLNQFSNLIQSNHDLLINLSTIIENLLLPTYKDRQNMNSTWQNSFTKLLRNFKCVLIWLFIVIGINIAFPVWRYFSFTTDPSTMNESVYLAIARSSGFALDFNCTFILIPMLRHSLTLLRHSWIGRYFPIDDHREFHKITGFFIYLFGLVHIVAHLLHVGLIVVPDKTRNPMNLNAWQYIFNPKATPGLGLVHGDAYLTGFIIVGSLIVLAIGILPYFRSHGCFHIFYWTHFLAYWIFFPLMIIHSRMFWKYFTAVALLYIAELMYGSWHGFSTYATTCSILPYKVTALVIKRPKRFTFSPGDYVFLKIPQFSKYEWHPFTISSAPEILDELTLHIRAVGPWTNTLHEYIQYLIRNRDFCVSHQIYDQIVCGSSRASASSRCNHETSFSTSSDDMETNGDSAIGKRNTASSSEKSYIHLRKIPTIVNLFTASSDLEDFEDDSDLTSVNVIRTRKLGFFSCSPCSKQDNPTETESLIPSGPSGCWKKPGGYGSVTNVATPLLNFSHTNKKQVATHDILKVNIAGPYGAPFSDIFWADHVILIGAGIGVTPFASILQSIMHRHWKSKITCPCPCNHQFAHNFQSEVNRLKKVDFFWVNNNQHSFEWFVNLLSNLEIEQEELSGNMERFLTIHMYMTKALRRTDMRAVGLQLALDLWYKKNKRDLIAGLRSRMRAGGPNWDDIFEDVSSNKKGKVEVFYCGPPGAINLLRKLSIKYGFTFRTETF